jgi:uncharacterized membrane protein
MITPLIILGLLLLPLVFAWLIGGAEKARAGGILGIAFAFIFFGIGHFVQTEEMVEMLPSFVPFAVPLVLATGVLELAIGLGLLSAVTRRIAGIVAILVFVGFFPANVFAAFNHVGMGGHVWGPVYLLIRAPLQALLIWWVWYFTLSPNGRALTRSAPIANVSV